MANKVLDVAYDPTTKELVDVCGSKLYRPKKVEDVETIEVPGGGGQRAVKITKTDVYKFETMNPLLEALTWDYTLIVKLKFYNPSYFAGAIIGTDTNISGAKGWNVYFGNSCIQQHDGFYSSGIIDLKNTLEADKWYTVKYSRNKRYNKCYINDVFQGEVPAGGYNLQLCAGATIGQWWYQFNHDTDMFLNAYIASIQMYDDDILPSLKKHSDVRIY